MSSESSKPALVLVVEDDPLIRMATVDLLERAGFFVLEASGADEAITLLQQRLDIRLIVTDIDMPGSMDGLALAWAVRDRWPPVKIIVMSGRRVLDEGSLPVGSRFFGKPVDERSMLAAISELVS